jgi:hypothetical protein
LGAPLEFAVSIPQNSNQKELAQEFIDILTGPRGEEILENNPSWQRQAHGPGVNLPFQGNSRAARLDPVKAYDMHLVKRIEVDSILDKPDLPRLRPHARYSARPSARLRKLIEHIHKSPLNILSFC